jgi:hypothetical protein
MSAQLLRIVFVGALAAPFLTGQQPGGSDPVLAAGDPPLTRSMVDRRLAVWEAFLQVRFTTAEREALANTIVDRWNQRDKEEIKNTLSDVKLYGHEAELKAARDANQAQFVQNLRNEPGKPQYAILLRAFQAAHPDDRDVMHARGLDDLVGKWEQGDAMTAGRNPITHRTEGISFTDALVLNIYSDGRFRHLWSHSHCSNGMCCRQYGTAANGTIEVNGSTLVLANETGQMIARDPCLPSGNTGKTIEPVRETFHWSLQTDPATHARKLCLSRRPFQFTKEDTTKPGCYVKQR